MLLSRAVGVSLFESDLKKDERAIGRGCPFCSVCGNGIGMREVYSRDTTDQVGQGDGSALRFNGLVAYSFAVRHQLVRTIRRCGHHEIAQSVGRPSGATTPQAAGRTASHVAGAVTACVRALVHARMRAARASPPYTPLSGHRTCPWRVSPARVCEPLPCLAALALVQLFTGM